MILSRIIALVIGYCCGLFQTGLIVAKAKGVDIRSQGSGNSGMTNSIRVMGWKAGLMVVAGDFLKCLIAMIVTWFLFKNLYPDAGKLFVLYAGLGGVLGHNYPFFLKFKGGKGISCSISIVFAFDWRMFPICTLLFFLPVIPTGFMSLGSLGILTGFFVQTVVFGQMGWLPVGAQYLAEAYILAAILTGLAFWQHRANIKRLANGTENKFAPSHKEKNNNPGKE